MDMKEFKHAFLNSNIKLDEPLSTYSFTHTGGPADAVVFPKTVDELQSIVHYLHERSIPMTVLGNGSNLIIADGGIRGVVLILTDMDKVWSKGKRVIAQCGASLLDASKKAQESALTGLEFAYGIPGSVGGAIYMNAGAYGGEVKDVVESVRVMTREGNIKDYSHEEMAFDYRYSKAQESKDIILETSFLLEEGDADQIWEKMDELMTLRKNKQPLEYPSCGSVFKRPEGHYAGKLIQDAGLQGYQIGGVQVSTKHAGFMVNVDQGTAQDYMDLIEHVQKVVKEKFDVDLEREVRIIGDV